MANILIVEDDTSLQTLIKYDLEMIGYSCDTCDDGSLAIDLIKSNNYEIILLDYMLPSKNGIEVLQTIRSFNKDSYVILLTAIGDEITKLRAFESGCDDYVTKPFSMREVIARIKAFQNRNNKQDIQVFKHLQIDLKKHLILNQGVEVDLTLTEFNLFLYLFNNCDNVVSREQILDYIWGYEYDGETRVVDIYVHKLRDKLGLDGYIKTVRGVGYILRLQL